MNKRRRLIIEWDDEMVDTDEDCLRDFLSGAWSIEDLIALDKESDPRFHVNMTAKVEDAT